MTNPFDMKTPETTNVADRIEWAGERVADVAEGLLDRDEAWTVWNIIVGWADLCDENARRQYLDLAGRIADILQNQEAA